MFIFSRIKNKILGSSVQITSNKDARRNSIMNELQNEINILNPGEIADQIILNKSPIRYQYKDNILYTVNEPSSVYHIVKSIGKIENLVNSIDLIDCKVALDIGAHSGLFAYFLKKKYPNVLIYLFEADKDLLPIISMNLKAYKNWELLNIAITDEDDKEINFYINPNSTQTNSTIKEAVTIIEAEERIIIKQAISKTIDTFCSENNLNEIDVIKIDIQGGEVKAFRKGQRTLANTKILLAEASFFVDDTYDFLSILKIFFKKQKPINDVFMGADIKFYN